MKEIEQEELVDRRSPARAVAERVLVLAPTGDDASLVSQILTPHGYDVVPVADVAVLAHELEAGAGVALIASEALEGDGAPGGLRQLLEQQEPWSDIPVLLLGGSGEAEAARAMGLLGASAHVVLLERPLGIATLITAIDAALRSRRRQYEVKRLLGELAQSAEAVTRAYREADRAKDEFLATLAHELRSPMTAIRGWIQLLKTGELDAAEAADALAMIESSTKVQAHIVEDLMDMSRILAGKAMIEPALIDLTPVVAKIVATFRASGALVGLDVTADLPQEPLIVWGDEVRLQQVGWNLVSNAIKFTPRGGSVRVTLRRENDSAVIRVRDTGQGISSDLLPHVFERYRQQPGAMKEQHRGLGLGLAIVRHLVESHGGTIEAFSEGLGKGSEFVVTLPLAASDDAAGRP